MDKNFATFSMQFVLMLQPYSSNELIFTLKKEKKQCRERSLKNSDLHIALGHPFRFNSYRHTKGPVPVIIYRLKKIGGGGKRIFWERIQGERMRDQSS